MTDRLYFTEGHHKDYAAIIEREASVTGVTPNGDREYYGYDEVTKTIQGVERYSSDEQNHGALAEGAARGEGMYKSHVTASTDSPSQATESDAPPGEGHGVSGARNQLYTAMMDAGIDPDDISITNIPSDEVLRIELSDDIDDYDAIDAWTDSRFGKDKPGYIDWTEYEKDDGSTGYYPDAYCVPYDALEDVVG